MSHKLYKKETYDFLIKLFFQQQPPNLLRKNRLLQNFPLKFYNYQHKDNDFPFYSKLMVNKIQKQMFLQLLSLLQQQRSLHTTQKSLIQQRLEYQVKQSLAQSGCFLRVDNVQVKRIQTFEELEVQGVFIHRRLNLPQSCYSTEKISTEKKNKRNQLLYRMRSKLTREDYMAEWENKKALYQGQQNRYFEFYMDGYENFMATQRIIRSLLVVYAKIEGQIVYGDGNTIKLPLDEQKPISTHVMQVEHPLILGDNDPTRVLLTDIDYLLDGNPYFQS